MEFLVLLGTPLARPLRCTALGFLRRAALGARAQCRLLADHFPRGLRAHLEGREHTAIWWSAREQFFIDAFNVFLVTLTAFVGLTTSLFSRPYMRIEARSRAGVGGTAAPVPQHVPAVHGDDADRAHHQQHGAPVGRHGGRHAVHGAAGDAVPDAPRASRPAGNTSFSAASASPKPCSARFSCISPPKRSSARRASARCCGRI